MNSQPENSSPLTDEISGGGLFYFTNRCALRLKRRRKFHLRRVLDKIAEFQHLKNENGKENRSFCLILNDQKKGVTGTVDAKFTAFEIKSVFNSVDELMYYLSEEYKVFGPVADPVLSCEMGIQVHLRGDNP